jgi:hypothetical protein
MKYIFPLNKPKLRKIGEGVIRDINTSKYKMLAFTLLLIDRGNFILLLSYKLKYISLIQL